MMLGDLPSASVKFPCCQETFRQFPSTFRVTVGLSVNFVNFLCGQETFCQIPSTFCAVGRPSATFRQLSVCPGDLPSPTVNFPGSLQEVSWRYRKLAEVDGSFPGHTES